jgi:hypothetical protein
MMLQLNGSVERKFAHTQTHHIYDNSMRNRREFMNIHMHEDDFINNMAPLAEISSQCEKKKFVCRSSLKQQRVMLSIHLICRKEITFLW